MSASGEPTVSRKVPKVSGDKGTRTAPAKDAGAVAFSSKSKKSAPKFGDVKLNHFERMQFQFIREATKKNVWYYRDRMSVPRGPCSLPVLKECWVNGIIDENTLVWGHGLMDWLPVRNIRTLVPQIRTVEVQLATWVKKTFGLKPALDRVRKERQEKRRWTSNQVNNMF